MTRFSLWPASIALGLVVGLTVSPAAVAQDSGILDDYSVFDKPDAEVDAILEDAVYLDDLYLAPGYEERMANINAVMVDQPEVWIDPESPYKGMKPDASKILADTLRQGLIDALSPEFEIVEEPGPGVLHIDWAITDLYLAKKKKSIFSYTPLGFVVSGVKAAAINDIWKKVDMVEMSLELKAVDAANGEMLAAAIVKEGARKDKKAGQKKRDPVTWDEVDALTKTIAARTGCRITNAKLPEAQREDCPAITYQADDD